MIWNTLPLPDDEMLVLLRVEDLDQPIALGFHEDGRWFNADHTQVKLPVIGWMDIHDAAQKLDA